MNNTLRNSVEQNRAYSAFLDAAVGIKQVGKEYVAFVNELPMLIKTNGLGATIAFTTYKNSASKLVYTQLETWLKEDANQYLMLDLSGGKRLHVEITRCSSMQYKAITIELLAYITCLRRSAKGLDQKI